MAHKYDLVTIDTTPKGPKKHHPWYKERLKLKFVKNVKNATALNAERWISVYGGTDDFRSGVPFRCKDMVKRPKVNPVPLINVHPSEQKAKTSSHLRSPAILSGNPGFKTLHSKVGPRSQIQQERLAAVEAGLLHHPLALYPHLEESIPPDIAEDVVELLDPALNELLDESSDNESSSDKSPQLSSELKRRKESSSSQPSQTLSSTLDEITADRNGSGRTLQGMVYKFPLMKTNEEKEQEKDLIASRQVISAKQQSRVKEVTQDLVDWGAQLGTSDDLYTMDEPTIRNLFVSDYEAQPILIAPIQVVELTNVPRELQSGFRTQQNRDDSRSNSQSMKTQYHGFKRIGSRATVKEKLPWKERDDEPRVVKTKYGAWYLPIKYWKPLPEDMPLVNPDSEASQEERQKAIKKMEMDLMISNLHGARSFKEFIINNKPGAAVPSYLDPADVVIPEECEARRRTKSYRPTSNNH